ncbi:MAG: gamma carbonic anhydrase family protein [Bacillota bacterium]|nr:MAG: gamma carbonic anhydrase family protein [Bacillota bacterium]
MSKIRKGKNVFLHSRAYVSGDVTLCDGANIWCGACIRGDIAPVKIGRNTNVQDNATIHVGYDHPAVLGENVTVGHNAVVHGCTIGDNVIVGMGSIVLDGAKIGANCIIGAGTLIPGGKEIPDESVVVGNPYRILRKSTEADKRSIAMNAKEYLLLAEAYVRDGEGQK